MLGLAAFADEISPDLDVQIATCKKHGVTHVDLRGVAGKNVFDFDKSMRAEIKRSSPITVSPSPASARPSAR
jgi:hypothetical protein